MKHVIRIWTYDTPEAHRIKEGDIVSIRPVNEQSIINTNENAKKTIAFIINGLTDKNTRIMTESEYEDGRTEDQYESELLLYQASCDEVKHLMWEDDEKTIPLMTDPIYTINEITGKTVLLEEPIQRTYIEYIPNENSLPMPEPLVIVKKRRYNIPLQTLKDGWCKDLDLDKVRDPESTYQPVVSEVNALEKVALCKDKFKGTFKYLAKKVI